MKRETLTGAKKKFLDDYASKIAEKGYTLAVGVGWESEKSKKFDALVAIVQSTDDLKLSERKSIEKLLPKHYVYEETKIPVNIEYAINVRMY